MLLSGYFLLFWGSSATPIAVNKKNITTEETLHTLRTKPNTTDTLSYSPPPKPFFPHPYFYFFYTSPHFPMAALLCCLMVAASVEKFESLQEVVGHYALKSCQRVARKDAHSRTQTLKMLEACDTLADRLEHMIAVSGDDAMIQLHNRGKDESGTVRKTVTKKRGARPSKEYYREVIRTATTGAHHQQLLKMVRKAAEWLLAQHVCPPVEQISAHLQPDVGQWLINVASKSDPRVTSKEMRDEEEEELLD